MRDPAHESCSLLHYECIGILIVISTKLANYSQLYMYIKDIKQI